MRRVRIAIAAAVFVSVVLLSVLMAMLSGCQDMGRAAAKLYGVEVDPFPGPCAPESVQAGHCIPRKTEGGKP